MVTSWSFGAVVSGGDRFGASMAVALDISLAVVASVVVLTVLTFALLVVFSVLDNLDAGIGRDHGVLVVGQVVIGLALFALLLLPPHLDDADLGEERVLDE